MRVGDVYEDGVGRKVVILEIRNRYLTVEKHYIAESGKRVFTERYGNEEELIEDGFFPSKETKVLRILKDYEKIRDRR